MSEQSYSELNIKYNEVYNTKQSLQKEVMELQSALDHERSSHRQMSSQSSELSGKSVLSKNICHQSKYQFIRSVWIFFNQNHQIELSGY